jgi:L-aspartate semialdehyde sulfurtransferase ferredoxin
LSKKAFNLYFSQNLIKEPIMFLVAREYNLLLNIRRAKITAEAGEATIELEGNEEQIEKAEKAFKDKGVKVQSVLGNIIEG